MNEGNVDGEGIKVEDMKVEGENGNKSRDGGTSS
jgi:hypothetical protein